VAVTLKVADWPVATVWLAGCAVIEGASGAGLTESVAALLVALPAPLLTTTVNSAPLSEELIVAAVV
jgi:membrane protease YdiL (CAAX protease family)